MRLGSVVLWVDKINFNKFVRGEEFTSWTDESTHEKFQIIVPSSAVIYTQEKSEGVLIKCYPKNIW
ncbi:hypothetical protein [Siminovitchia fordii]|uniref:Uncharacterized protein n=1 Tax=Siminovitchia fordii TaxID=254759 RepID=A0ABQ4KA03_9BACI|nr:hypothetical protein [Siminovitchia fordii]GIN22555.1 hypothetical protein J1TS3_36890 [Siminovitchia fordii]